VPEREKIFLASGVELTPELEEELADEAERGYDLSKARRHYLTRPLVGDESGLPRLTFSLTQDEIDALVERAADEERSVEGIVREALARYLKTPQRAAQIGD
jgi:hypothetical protein